MNRRSVIAGLVAIVSYVLYRVAAHNQWIIVTFGRRRYEPGIDPSQTPGHEALRLMVVGDTGKNTEQRAGVVAGMEKVAKAIQPNSTLLLGDNFYEDGVESVDDIRFETDFESLFPKSSFNIPFYSVLGNHDYNGNPEAQVQYSDRSTRWHMPARYYKHSFTDERYRTDLLVIDTNLIILGDASGEEQLDWINQQLRDSDALWKIVVGHHPVITGGQHDVSPRLAEQLTPILDRHRIDLYVAGHDHDLQLCESDHGWLQLVSGSGSKLRSTSWIRQTLFAEATGGFCTLTIDKHSLAVSFYDSTSHLFTHRITPKPMAALRSASQAAA